MSVLFRGRVSGFLAGAAVVVATTAAAVATPSGGSPGEPIFHAVADARSVPDNDVSCLAQDAAGFLWIGTRDGLLRYDGLAFRLFRYDAGDPRSLPGNRIRVLRGAPDGRVFVGTEDAGLAVYEPLADSFRSVTAASGLSSDGVRDVAEAGDGAIWVSTTRGLDLVDVTTLRATRADPKPAGMTNAERASLGPLLLDRRGDLWIGSADGLAVRRKSGRVEAVAASPAQGDSLAGKPVYRLFEARDGALWAGIFGGGLARIDPVSGVARFVDAEARVSAYAFAQTEPDFVWVGTSSDGIERRDAATGAVLARHLHDASVPESLVSSRIAALLVDRSGLVWIGTTGGGLAFHNPADAAFRLLRHSPLRPDGLTNGEVESVFESSDGLLWVGTHDNGVDVFDGARRVAGYRAGPEDGRTLDRPRVGAIAETPDGAIWLGTSGALNRLDRTRERIERIPAEAFGKTTGRITRLLPDAARGGLWVGSTAGLGFLDLGTRSCVPAEVAGGGPVAGNVTDLAFAADGTLWVTSLGGLASLPRGADRFRRVAAGDGTKGTLPPGSPLGLLADSKGRLWVGMSNGLFRLVSSDGGAPRFEPVPPALGLQNRRCENLLEDGTGRIWVEGEVVFDPGTLALRRFGVEEGAGRSIWRGAAVRRRSGTLVLGGPDGLLGIDPAALRPWTYAPAVALAALRVDGRSVPAARTEPLVVPSGTRTVAFELASLDLSAPRRNRYRYRLKGFDRDVTEVDAEHRSVTYTSLPPGSYVFEVSGSNRDGVFGPAGLSLPVRVEPALHQTLVFRIAAGLLLAGLTWPLYRVRLRLLEARQRELEALVASRTAALTESERRARDASEAKSVFLANMSHELRTPLNAVLGFAQLMRRSRALGPADRDSLAIIQRSGEHLLSLINQVLSISKIEAGKMTLDARPFDPRELLGTLERMLRSRAEEAGIGFRVEIGEAVPPAVLGDEGKLRQALLNLLGNAVKFTRAGEVSLSTSWSAGRATFEVKDTGAGIAEEELSSLFTPFVQTESGRAAKEGTGLGLAITKRIVELMGGTIRVASRRGEGTTFTFDVALPACAPVAAGPAPRRVARLAPGQRPPRVLVVDDTPENRSLLSRLLASVGVDVREAEDGAKALDAVRAWRPELVFMDVRMPVMDGREATRRIRAEEAGGAPRTVIVGLTASVLEEEAAPLRADGAEDVIFKPYGEDAIFDVLATRLGIRFEYEDTGEFRAPVSPRVATHGSAAPARRRVLLADDDPIGRALATEVLTRAGFEVVEASDGEEALARLDSEGTFDVVLLDVEMPRLGGIETLRRLRRDGRFSGLPVLAMTAHDDPDDVRRLADAGMDGHVAKPFEPEVLIRTLNAWADRRGRT